MQLGQEEVGACEALQTKRQRDLHYLDMTGANLSWLEGALIALEVVMATAQQSCQAPNLLSHPASPDGRGREGERGSDVLNSE